MSRPRFASLRLAASRSGGLPRHAGGAHIAAGEEWPPAGDAGMPQGVFRDCAREGRPLKYHVFYLSLEVLKREVDRQVQS